jgi:hypothetical protein
LQRLFPDHGYPQILIRLGYATETKPPTPRRSVDEVLASGVEASNQQYKEKYQNELAKN